MPQSNPRLSNYRPVTCEDEEEEMLQQEGLILMQMPMELTPGRPHYRTYNRSADEGSCQIHTCINGTCCKGITMVNLTYSVFSVWVCVPYIYSGWLTRKLLETFRNLSLELSRNSKKFACQTIRSSVCSCHCIPWSSIGLAYQSDTHTTRLSPSIYIKWMRRASWLEL